MKLILEVGYYDNVANAIGLLIRNNQEQLIIQKEILNPEPYVPGEFYKRELPCILEVIKETPIDRGCKINCVKIQK